MEFVSARLFSKKFCISGIRGQNFLAARLPLNPKFYTSGSSNETAAGIASGLAPYGFGTDGGGSIRKLSFLLRHFWIETDTWTILSSQFF